MTLQEGNSQETPSLDIWSDVTKLESVVAEISELLTAKPGSKDLQQLLKEMLKLCTHRLKLSRDDMSLLELQEQLSEVEDIISMLYYDVLKKPMLLLKDKIIAQTAELQQQINSNKKKDITKGSNREHKNNSSIATALECKSASLNNIELGDDKCTSSKNQQTAGACAIEEDLPTTDGVGGVQTTCSAPTQSDDIQPTDLATPASGDLNGDVEPSAKSYSVHISTYGYEDSAKNMKLYVDIPGLLPEHNNRVECSFTISSVCLRVTMALVTYHLNISNLAGPVDVAKSKCVTKKGSVRVVLSKLTAAVAWAGVTAADDTVALAEQNTKDTEAQAILIEHAAIYFKVASQRKSLLKREDFTFPMRSHGFYHVYDDSSADSALVDFAKFAPRVVALTLGSDGKRELSAIFKTLITVVAESRCQVLLFNKATFLAPVDHHTDATILAMFLNKRCTLTNVMGHYSAKDMARIPGDVDNVGLAIADVEDAKAVANVSLNKKVVSLIVSVSRHMKYSDLLPLPNRHDIHFNIVFTATTDQDIKWAAQCINSLTGARKCIASFCSSQLSYVSVLAVMAMIDLFGLIQVFIETEALNEQEKRDLTVLFALKGCPITWECKPSQYHLQWS